MASGKGSLVSVMCVFIVALAIIFIYDSSSADPSIQYDAIGSHYGDYSLEIEDAISSGANWEIKITPTVENEVELPSYALVVRIDNDHHVKLISIKSNGSNVHVLIPNQVSIGGELYSIVQIGNGSALTTGNIKSIITEDNTTVSSISQSAFNGRTSLSYVILGEGLRTIGSWAFQGTGVIDVIFPTSLESIGEAAFRNCSDLRSIDMADGEAYSLEDVGITAFLGCASLECVSLPFANDFIPSISRSSVNLFYESPNLISIETVNGSGKFIVDNTGTLEGTRPNWIYELMDDGSLKILTATSVPEFYVTEQIISAIGPNSFITATNLHNLTISDGVTDIGENAFKGLGIETVTFGDTVQRIVSGAFSNNNLTTINLPDSLQTVGEDAFGYNSNLTTVLFEGGEVNVNKSFTGSPVSTISCLDENGRIYTDWWIITGSKDVTELTINGPFVLSEMSFNANSALRKVTLGGRIRDIDSRAFTGCNNIECFEYVGEDERYASEAGVFFVDGDVRLVPAKAKVLNLTTPVSSISATVFSACNSLTTLSFSSGSTLTEIPAEAFKGCASLVSITIPSSVVTIGSGAFYGCSNLSEIIIGDDSNLITLGEDAFRGTGIVSLILPGKVETIGNRCFMGCMNMVAIEIKGNSLKTIGQQAWAESYLRSLSVPGSITNIDSTAFHDCSNLSSIIIAGDSAYSFDGSALYKGNRLILLVPSVLSYTLPSNINEIEKEAFDGATDLQEIITGDNSTYVAYLGVLFDKEMTSIISVPKGIRNVFMPSSFSSIGVDYSSKSPFSGCHSIESFTWEGESITLDNTRIASKVVVLDSTSTIELGSFSFSNVDTLILRAPTITITGGSTMAIPHVGTIYMETDELIIPNSFYCTDLCLDSEDSSTIETILSIAEDAHVERVFTSKEVNVVSQKYSGLFRYDGDRHAVMLPILHSFGISIFSECVISGVSISEINLDSNKLSFCVSVQSGYVGDFKVLVDGVEPNYDELSGRYETSILNTNSVTISVEPLSSDTLYDVHFELNGGTGTVDIQVMSGGTVKRTEIILPRKSGYTFDGWYSDSELTETYDFLSKVKSDLVLYAKWTYNGGKYSVNVISHEYDVVIKNGLGTVSSGSLIVGGTTLALSFRNVPSWECLGWIINGQECSELAPTVVLDKDYYIEPLLRYVSSSNDLVDITDLKTPRYEEDVYLQYALSSSAINTSMGVWSGFPSTPVIMDDALFVRIGDVLYKYDANTGEILATAESKLLVNYYLYLGVGGGKVFDYATGKVYDANLNHLYDSPIKFNAVFYYSGYFYGHYGGHVYKLNASNGSLVTSGQWKDGVACDWFCMYGTTSAPIFVNGHMFIIEARTSDDYRGLRSIDLENGSSTALELNSISGRLLDDGWLSYTEYSGRIILFLPSYSKGLFDTGTDYERASLTAVVVNENGTIGNGCPVVSVKTNEYNMSATFLVYQGRGYMSTGLYLYVVDANSLCDTIIHCGSGVTLIEANDFESEYVIYKEASVGSHGSIVLSTGYYKETGKVYVYILPYGPPSAVYIFEDYATKTEAAGYYKTSNIGANYCSQAVRVTLRGNLVWYTDSGIVYCCGTMENNPYHFSIINDESALEIDGYGATALDALRNALGRNGIENDVSGSGRIISLCGQTGKWKIESYYNSKWNTINSLSSSSNNVHHTYRISFDSSSSTGQEIEISITPDIITLMLDSDEESKTVTISGNVPSGVSFAWEPIDEGIVSIIISSDTGSATIAGLKEGSTIINVILVGDGVYGEAQLSVTVVENPNPPERSYTFTIRMDYDADKADYGESGYRASDLRAGITLNATGHNAGEALEKALDDAKIPCDFFSNDTLLYWVNHIFGMEQVHYSNGDWKYWVQYQVMDGEPAYNDYTLGYFKKGGNFLLVYGITDETNHMVGPDSGNSELNEWSDNIGEQSSVITRHNDDGSTTTVIDSTSVIDGTQTTVEITTVENDDGTVTIREKTTVTNPDGTTSITNSVTRVATDGTKTTESTVTNPDGTTSITNSVTRVATDGTKTTESTVTNPDGTNTTVTSSTNSDGTVTTVMETSKDASGNIIGISETVVTVTGSTVNDVRTTTTQQESTVTDASGNVTVVKVSETAVKQADGSVVVVRSTETTAGSNMTTDIAVGAISVDGKVHTTAVSSDSDIITNVAVDGDDGNYAVSSDVIQTAMQQQTAVESALGVDKGNVIEIVSDTRDITASVDKESFETMADGSASFRMTSAQGSMTFGRDILSSLSGKDDVTLSFTTADRSSMTSAQRDVIELGSTVINLSAMSGGQSIGKDLGGKVTVTVKYSAADGKGAIVYYIDEDGNRFRVAEQSYDAENGTVTMVLEHFSIYMIVDEESSSNEIGAIVYIAIAAVAVVLLTIVGAAVYRKKMA